MKKHQLVEADIVAHEDRIKDMNDQADSLVESGQFDSSDILEKRDLISTRYKHIQAALWNRNCNFLTSGSGTVTCKKSEPELELITVREPELEIKLL
jgi:hypothetical protein